LAHAEFFFYLPKEKRTFGQYQLPLANISFHWPTSPFLKSNLEQAIRIIPTEEFAVAHRR
jgi:hypothetical protein